MNEIALKSLQRRLMGHGGLVLLWGFVMGFGFLFFLLGEIKLWPVPGALKLQLPGTYDAWRMAHMEGVVNGLALWIAALLLPILPAAESLMRKLVWAFILTAWTFAIASAFDPLFTDSRGLAFGLPFTNMLAFFLFYVGVVAIIWAAGCIAWICLRRD